MKQIGNSRRPRQRSAPRSAFFTSEFPPDISSLSRSEVIAKYHEIRKNLVAIDNSPQFPNEASKEAMRQVLKAQLAMIGIEKYQNASRAGESLGGGFDSSQWVLKKLPQYADRYLGECDSTISLLDVGAIAHRFPSELIVPQGNNADNKRATTISLKVTSIDLNPEDSEAGKQVIKADFFDFAMQKLNHDMEKYHVICLSLCVNFEGCPRRRGLMLSLASRLLRPHGLLFLVLPGACVKNSRYLDDERFRVIMEATGVKLLSITYTSKLMQSILERREAKPNITLAQMQLLSTKEILRTGKERNNFSICLDTRLLHDNGSNAQFSVIDADTSQDIPVPRKIPQPRRKKRKKNTKRKSHISEIQKNLKSNERKRARRKAMRRFRSTKGES
ncbi:unnamed protein product [Chondrus crispus]|uniref:Uncharacterized protein n=1 Tax=Chondrus crispus TaxID=2769 RepID=R7QGD7_CHOCR|nr:unnamed protein product [Chondrus crispus]CDF36496.1 unnamed protein product [Chondrus crispus]|eukprot:XP_005716315.1 unnamed protein product [Chondrus crispus]